MMLRCFRHSKKYEARKFELSQDLGDYFDALAERQAAAPPAPEGDEDDEEDDEADVLWMRRVEEE
jgi:hypothetical protein